MRHSVHSAVVVGNDENDDDDDGITLSLMWEEINTEDDITVSHSPQSKGSTPSSHPQPLPPATINGETERERECSSSAVLSVRPPVL